MSMIDTLNEVEYETTELELEIAEDHDNIGWQNFTEGRISKLYVEYQRRYYKTLKERHGLLDLLKISLRLYITNGHGEMRSSISANIMEQKLHLSMSGPWNKL